MTSNSENNKKATGEPEGFLKSFFAAKINAIALIITVLVIGLLVGYYTIQNELLLTPGNEQFSFSPFVDNGNGGNSEVFNVQKNDSVISFDFLLKEGFMNPYVGLNISHATETFFSANNSNQIMIDISTEGMENLGLYQYTFSKANQKKDVPEIITFYHSIKLLEGRNKYVVSLRELKIPDWFLQENNNYKAQDHAKPNFNKVQITNITTAYPAKIGDTGSLKIYSVVYNRNNRALYAYAILCFISLVFILIIVHFIKRKFSATSETLTISYKPIEVEKSKLDQKVHLSFISANFSNSELSLEMVSEATGMQQRSVTNDIHSAFGCNFKTYVNHIRINESKRLLKESNLNVGEIAYKVGFNNQSHFNRVFKSVTSISPTAYREQKK